MESSVMADQHLQLCRYRYIFFQENEDKTLHFGAKRLASFSMEPV